MFSYATLAGVKTRMAQAGQPFGDQDNGKLQAICNQVNGWIESRTGRPLGPYPAFSTTVVSGGTIGSQSVTLASTTGLAIADAIMLGAVGATHEHGIVANITGSVVSLQWPLAAAYGGPVLIFQARA